MDIRYQIAYFLQYNPCLKETGFKSEDDTEQKQALPDSAQKLPECVQPRILLFWRPQLQHPRLRFLPSLCWASRWLTALQGFGKVLARRVAVVWPQHKVSRGPCGMWAKQPWLRGAWSLSWLCSQMDPVSFRERYWDRTPPEPHLWVSQGLGALPLRCFWLLAGKLRWVLLVVCVFTANDPMPVSIKSKYLQSKDTNSKRLRSPAPHGARELSRYFSGSLLGCCAASGTVRRPSPPPPGVPRWWAQANAGARQLLGRTETKAPESGSQGVLGLAGALANAVLGPLSGKEHPQVGHDRSRFLKKGFVPRRLPIGTYFESSNLC